MAETGSTRRVVSIHLEDAASLRQSPEAEQERAVAIFDLIEENEFVPSVEHPGPYHLVLAVQDNKLVFDLRDTENQEVYKFILSLTPFRRIIKEYFDVCESYYAAIKASSLSQIEPDECRRGQSIADPCATDFHRMDPQIPGGIASSDAVGPCRLFGGGLGCSERTQINCPLELRVADTRRYLIDAGHA